MGGLSNGPILDTHTRLTPQTGGSKCPPLKLQPSRRPQIDHILWVVERPDHHCGDDLVTYVIANELWWF